mmetsp:Transcript_8971/g.19383  ORF Transcript_8971/g.19383 Transcript_8971/m.19383 type:complete len:704 (+) Transcript_8971:211-2322(+)
MSTSGIDNKHTSSNSDGIPRRPRRDSLGQVQEVGPVEPLSTSTEDRTDVTLPQNANATKMESPTNSTSTSSPVQSKQKCRTSLALILLRGMIHLGCIALYLIPILTENKFAGPTLDEAHVMSGDVQKDIHDPNATFEQIFSNDYWGRPMNSPSSHKSWRPLTVLSFRYLKGPFVNLATQSAQQLTVHRLVNAACHAAAGEVVGQLATQLFVVDQNETALWLHLITKILFCLHPTHVEVTANAANRNHIMAVLLGVILCFPGNSSKHGSDQGKPYRLTTPFWLFFGALIAGYLASETFMFMIPGVMVTMTVVAFTAQQQKATKGFQQLVLDYLHAILSISPRLVLITTSLAVYIGGRWYFDTLDIPTGLIRPAESPYFVFEGMKRVRNYLYILTVHLGKQWGSFLPKNFGGDPIGFSHEYGYDCIPEIEAWSDRRLIFGVGLHLVFAIVLSILLMVSNPRRFFGLIAIHWSWTLVTLFPICGILKVGTFVSDRIVLPSTVAVSLWTGRIVHKYCTEWLWKKDSIFASFRPLQFAFVLWWIAVSHATVHNRALEWMDSISLMKSALVTCPRFAKVHMEYSKIYSGLYPSLYDLKTSRHHLNIARAIDPDLCDLHKQFLLLALQEHKYREVEREITGALMCPFTASGTEHIWNQYWKQLFSSVPPGTPQHAEIEGRYRTAMAVVQKGIKKQQAAEAAQGMTNEFQT